MPLILKKRENEYKLGNQRTLNVYGSWVGVTQIYVEVELSMRLVSTLRNN